MCPVGALYALIAKISPFKVNRDANICINCGKCNKVCPMNIDIMNTDEIKSAECINCLKCVLECPKSGALNNKVGKKIIKPITIIILVMLLFFGSIFVFEKAGIYKVLPEQIKAGESISNTEIKGFMTIKEAAEATNTDIKEFYKDLKFQTVFPLKH